MLDRPSAERLTQLREWSKYDTVPAGIVAELFVELDAVTQEKNEFHDLVKRFNQTIIDLTRERDEALQAVERLLDANRVAPMPAKNVGLSGMNFITDREKGAR